jgi:hypothetical protein
VGQFLHQAGYELVFVDVVDALITSLQNTPTYTVTEVGEDGTKNTTVDNYRAISSKTDEAKFDEEMATADTVTCSDDTRSAITWCGLILSTTLVIAKVRRTKPRSSKRSLQQKSPVAMIRASSSPGVVSFSLQRCLARRRPSHFRTTDACPRHRGRGIYTIHPCLQLMVHQNPGASHWIPTPACTRYQRGSACCVCG